MKTLLAVLGWPLCGIMKSLPSLHRNWDLLLLAIMVAFLRYHVYQPRTRPNLFPHSIGAYENGLPNGGKLGDLGRVNSRLDGFGQPPGTKGLPHFTNQDRGGAPNDPFVVHPQPTEATAPQAGDAQVNSSPQPLPVKPQPTVSQRLPQILGASRLLAERLQRARLSAKLRLELQSNWEQNDAELRSIIRQLGEPNVPEDRRARLQAAAECLEQDNTRIDRIVCKHL